MIIEERPTQMGGFLVGRVLPFRQKRMVGPFIFLDHMGPATLAPGTNLDVGPHPHIGLSTLTYLLEGTILHKDSLGTEMEITPGAVNWMTAGRGITHSERTPERLRGSSQQFHGLQLWVALPTAHELDAPSFYHIPAQDIPVWKQDGIALKLIAGQALGKASPVPVYSPMYMLELRTGDAPATADFGGQLYGESGLYILAGNIQSGEHSFGPKHMLVSQEPQLCGFEMAPNTTVYIFGGEAFPEPRHIHWNFVSSDLARLEQAKADWYHDRFPHVPGETERVPLPNYPPASQREAE